VALIGDNDEDARAGGGGTAKQLAATAMLVG